jgi:hypothetical protein
MPRMSIGTHIDQFRASVRGVKRHQWVIGGLSVLMTAIIVVAFLVESRFGYLARDPIVVYFKSWTDDRSRAEALAEQEEEKKLKAEADAIAAKLDVAAPPAATAAPAKPETK